MKTYRRPGSGMPPPASVTSSPFAVVNVASVCDSISAGNRSWVFLGSADTWKMISVGAVRPASVPSSNACANPSLKVKWPRGSMRNWPEL